MRFLAVKNFEEYQHYSDRTPPWIKLYNSLLDDYAFLRLSESAQINLVKLWLLASRHDNRIPNDLVYISGKIQPKSAIDIDELIVSGFLSFTDEPPKKKAKKKSRKPRKDRGLQRKQNASTPLAKSSKNARPEREGETERETEGEKEIKTLSGARAPTRRAVPDEHKIPVQFYDHLQRAWTAQAGAVEVPRFRKRIKIMLQSGIRVGQIERAIPRYVAAMRAKDRAIKLEWFAEDVQTWIRAADAIALEVEPAADFGFTQEQAAAKIAVHYEQLRIRDEALAHRLTASLEVVA